MNKNYKHLVHYNDSHNILKQGFIDITIKHRKYIGMDIIMEHFDEVKGTYRKYIVMGRV